MYHPLPSFLSTLNGFYLESVAPLITGKAIEGLKAVHPYEEPAYDVIKLEKF